MILAETPYLALALWLAIAVGHYFRYGSLKFGKFSFSHRNYYILLSPLVLSLIISSLKAQSWRSIIVFVIFGVAGMIGETVISKWWQIFFGQRFWVYTVKTIYHKYTSWLNFIPWALGGYLYLNIIDHFGARQGFAGVETIFFVLMAALIMVQIFLFNLFKPSHGFKFHQATWRSMVVFYAPIFIAVVVLASYYGPVIYELAAWFAVIGTATEYLFGKACHFFISKKLWDYVYLSRDNGHFTPLSLPLFMLGGFYFWAIIRIAELVF